MKYAREHGYQLPEDLSIIGFDNVIFANYLYPTLTTVDNPVASMGKMATRMILKDVYQQKNIEINRLFEPTVIMRDSVTSN